MINCVQQMASATWTIKNGICSRCYDEFDAIAHLPYRMEGNLVEDYKVRFLDFYVFPLIERLNADAAYTGKGVTICFIDSGFCMHPDVKNRVIKVVDITNDKTTDLDFFIPNNSAWHGTMTSTVCAGNGVLSNGLYKGLASQANLVLLKVQNESGKITDASITKALQWVLDNHQQYNIRVLNLSISGDAASKLEHNDINQLSEKLFEQEVLVVAAVGNSTDGAVMPPASSPHVIAVGGLDDDNKLDGDVILYHSTFGFTADGWHKPELVSNAIWIPAPILPQTPAAEKASILFQALENEEQDYAIIKKNAHLFPNNRFHLLQNKEEIVEEIKRIIWEEKFISPYYMHVDGTSFAAPIVCSVAAQMLEADPTLAVKDLRRILFQTALPLVTYDVARQGYGRLQSKAALYAVVKKEIYPLVKDSPIIDYNDQSITFYTHHPNAKRTVSLAGSFNNWKKNEVLLKPAANGIWYVKIPLLNQGIFEYKFYIDNIYWAEDMQNSWRVPDGLNGWNNVLEITNDKT